MSLTARNERLKLTATYLNGVAIAIFAVGGFAPILTIVASPAAPSIAVVIFVVICFPTSAAIHLLARRMLKGLQDDDDV